MISKEDYLSLVKRFVNNDFINPNMLNVDLGQLSPLEQGFIFSITREVQASRTILESIQYNELGPLEKLMLFDSRILNFLSTKPGSKQYIHDKEFWRMTEEALEFDPESIIGLYARIYQVIYKKEYKEAIQLLERLQKKITFNDKLTYLLIMSYFYLQDINKSKSELLNLSPSLQKFLISFVLFYSGSLVYRTISGLLLLIIFIIINPFWLTILLVFLLNILLLSVGFFYRNNIVISLGVSDILSSAMIAGLGLFARYLISTI
jgi:hypothetical protein